MMTVTVTERWKSGLALLLSFLIALPGFAAPQADSIDKLIIEVVKGDNATYNARELTTQEFIVEVRDDNNKPVAGAAVVFFLPKSGPGGQFPGGAKSLTVMTDQKGQAVAKGFVHNAETGKYQVRVEASYQGLKAQTVINQAIAVPSAPAVQPKPTGGFNTLLVVGLAAAAAAGVAIAVGVSGGNNSPAPGPGPTPPRTTISPGTPSVGAP